jgi:4-alpha-glucanotransferase
VRFHQWLQWLLDQQLAQAEAALPVMQDLPIGFDPAGADAWAWQDVLAADVTVGAPPDEFNTQGQDWGLPPFVPWKLRNAGYEPFIETMRAALRHAGGLRVDHVMGLFRLFWIGSGGSAADGTYVRYPAGELLDLLALESTRARAWVVGEDLGTVEEDVRAELAVRHVLSTRVLWFEEDAPERWPERSLATVTTHDLPTVAGVWTGSDVTAQRTAGRIVNDAAEAAVRRRLRAATGLPDGAPVTDVSVAAAAAVGRAPSQVALATLEDGLGVHERPNMPGTTEGWPNWSLALPVPLEELEGHPGAVAVAGALAAGRDDPAVAPSPRR